MQVSTENAARKQSQEEAGKHARSMISSTWVQTIHYEQTSFVCLIR